MKLYKILLAGVVSGLLFGSIAKAETVLFRTYGAATTVNFALYQTTGTELKTDASSATGDVTIIKDEGTEATLSADAFTDEGSTYSLTLTAAEMTAKRVVLHIVDQGTKTWIDKVIIIETTGGSSAQHAGSLERRY